MPIKILVNGSNGQLGKELQDIQNQYPDLDIKFYAKNEWDINSEIHSQRILEIEKADYLIHTAAYTKVDLAEVNSEICFQLNAYAPQFIAGICKKYKTRMLYISSDYVFSNNEPALITEDTPKATKGVYAKSKSLGEDLILDILPECLIIRTSWLYSSYGHNFVKTMLHLGQKSSKIKVVNDQTGSPTYARHLAHALLKMITQTAGKTLDLKNRVFHYSNQGTCTWYEFAIEIFKYSQINVELEKISTNDFGAAAPRPSYSGLDCSRIQQQFEFNIPTWKVALHECLDRILPNNKDRAHENV
ncbi:MAG: dTDP-4-dehydrorhamnose reductase [Saprospiraceae bacterium]|nr:dTDP-4-dehydrorhamnose reductase [Saprospiraceae bacterium]